MAMHFTAKELADSIGNWDELSELTCLKAKKLGMFPHENQSVDMECLWEGA